MRALPWVATVLSGLLVGASIAEGSVLHIVVSAVLCLASLTTTYLPWEEE